MIRVVATFKLAGGNIDKALQVAKPLVEETRKESGCVQYDFAQSNTDENVFVMLEAWETQEALDVHAKTTHFTTYVPQLAELCAEAPVVETFTQKL